MNRQQRRRHSQQQFLSVTEFKQQIREEMIGEMNDLIAKSNRQLIDGFLLAMNSELKIGSVRGKRVVEKANELIQSMSAEDLHDLAKEKMF